LDLDSDSDLKAVDLDFLVSAGLGLEGSGLGLGYWWTCYKSAIMHTVPKTGNAANHYKVWSTFESHSMRQITNRNNNNLSTQNRRTSGTTNNE